MTTTLFIMIIVAILATTLFSIYLLSRTRDDNKKLYIFFALTFLSIVPRTINEMLIYVFPIFPFPVLQRIQYIFYLINLTLFFPVFLTFLKIRIKYKINQIMIWMVSGFAIVFGTILMFYQYPTEYDYDSLFPINMVLFIYATFTFTYSSIFYLIKERERLRKEKGMGFMIFGLFLMVFGDMVFASISIEITYVTLIMGIGLLYLGFKFNSMVKYENLLDLIESSVLIFDYNDKLSIMNHYSSIYFKKIDANFTPDLILGKRITEVFSFLGFKDYEKQLYLLKIKKDPIYLTNKKITWGNSENILNIGFHPFIFNENGEISKYIILINDITQAIKGQKLLEGHQMKIDLFKMLNNELRTPLFMIDGNARSLKNNILKLENETEKTNLLNDMIVIEKDLSNVLKSLKKIYKE